MAGHVSIERHGDVAVVRIDRPPANALDVGLLEEGHAVQAARKHAGLAVEDRIALRLAGDGDLLDAARAHEDYVTGETLATAIAYEGDGEGEPATIEGRELRIAVERA